MAKKLSFEQLVEWLEGRLDEAKAAEVAAQVTQADDETQAAATWLRTFLQVGDKIVLERPPQKVRARLTRRFAAYARDRQRPGFLQRLAASLTFDSGLNLAPAGVREASLQAQPRQLIYTADNTDITLHIFRPPGAATLTAAGQIFSDDSRPLDIFTVQLLQNGAEISLMAADELGEFTFTAVPSGNYTLILSSESVEIVISEIAIQE